MTIFRVGRCGLPLVMALSLCFFTGCVTAKKYKMAKSATPPAVALNYQSDSNPLKLTLQTVIVFRGPGSWKREARWDEYVVQLANSGPVPVVISSADLIDILGNPQSPGDDPWTLEKLSRTNWDKYGKSGLAIVEGTGAVILFGAAVSASSAGAIMGGGAAGAGLVVLDIIPVIAVVDITAVAVMNHQNKQKINSEFARRRLTLPITLAPGGTVQGSLFFPMVPGPHRLILHGNADEGPMEITLPLSQLSGLHLKKTK